MSALPADEIMHQDIVPLCAADIQEQLKKRFAYLSGKFRKPGVRGTARAWPVSGCFIALCEAPGHGEEVHTLSSVPLSTGQCPRSGELLRREVYLTHSCEGPRLRDASEGDLTGKTQGCASYLTVKGRVHMSVRKHVHVCLCPQVSLYSH